MLIVETKQIGLQMSSFESHLQLIKEAHLTEISLALDVGTTAIKAAAFGSDGQTLAAGSALAEVQYGSDGSNEQDPEAVWMLTASCLREVAESVDTNAIASLGICAQGDGFWSLDKTGTPVHNAILWSDTRKAAADDLAELAAIGALKEVGRGCNTALWPGTSALGWRWLRRHAPELAQRVAHIVTCGDWIAHRLTGVLATDYCNATIPFLDIATKTYGSAVEALGCQDARDKISDPRPANRRLGSVTAEAAAMTGLPEGLPVAVATLDVGAMIVGLGLSEPGDTMMILGTTAVVNILTDQIEPNENPIAATILHPTAYEEISIRVLAPSTGSAAFDWFTSLHPLSLRGKDAGETAEKLNALVDRVPVGANGVTFLPYLNGERAPFVDPSIRAGFIGMASGTKRGELGRAVMEGAALSLRHCFEEESGLPNKPVQLTGGGARNPVWCQIIADVIGQSVLVNTASDLGLWGAACIGSASVSGADPVATARRRVGDLDVFAPSAERHAAYGQVFARYRMLSDALRAVSRVNEMCQ